MINGKTYYEILGVRPDASETVIKTAYRAKALEFHPDTSVAPDAEARFKEINEAHSCLRDKAKRTEYDFNLRQQSANADAEAQRKKAEAEAAARRKKEEERRRREAEERRKQAEKDRRAGKGTRTTRPPPRQPPNAGDPVQPFGPVARVAVLLIAVLLVSSAGAGAASFLSAPDTDIFPWTVLKAGTADSWSETLRTSLPGSADVAAAPKVATRGKPKPRTPAKPAPRADDDLDWMRVPDRMTAAGWEDTPLGNLHLNCVPELYSEKALAIWAGRGNKMNAAVQKLCQRDGKRFTGKTRCRNQRAEINCVVDGQIASRQPAGVGPEKDCSKKWRVDPVVIHADIMTPYGIHAKATVWPRARCYQASMPTGMQQGEGKVSVRNGKATFTFRVRQAPYDPLLGACTNDLLQLWMEGKASGPIREVLVEIVDETCGDTLSYRKETAKRVYTGRGNIANPHHRPLNLGNQSRAPRSQPQRRAVSRPSGGAGSSKLPPATVSFCRQNPDDKTCVAARAKGLL